MEAGKTKKEGGKGKFVPRWAYLPKIVIFEYVPLFHHKLNNLSTHHINLSAGMRINFF
jgi:hypothetical protein